MRKILLLAFFLCLTACGRSTPTSYYLLESGATLKTTDNLPFKSLRVAQVEAPAYLNRNNIVSRVPNATKLILAEFHLWAEPVSNGVRRIVEQLLFEPLLTCGVNVLPTGTEEHGDYVLIIDVARLDGNFNEKAVFESYWALLDRNDKPLARGVYSAEQMVQGADYNMLVSAESALLQGYSQHLAKILPQYIRK